MDSSEVANDATDAQSGERAKMIQDHVALIKRLADQEPDLDVRALAWGTDGSNPRAQG